MRAWTVFLVGAASLVTAAAPAFADEPPPLPPPTSSKPAEKRDVVIEYVPGGDGASPGSPAKGDAPEALPPRDNPPKDKEKEDEGKTLRLAGRGEGGFQYSRLYGVPITGARGRIGIGAQNDSTANYATLSVLYGATENDLRTWDVRVGWQGDLLRFGVVRLGLDVEFGYLFIRRATFDNRMFTLGAGAGVHAGVDLFPFGPRNDHAVTAQVRFDTSLHFGGAFVWGPAVLVGFRY